MFCDPIPDELLGPLTAALEHVQVSIDVNSAVPRTPW
jgi:hypothetical protein